MTATQKNIVTKGVVISVVGFGAYYLYTVWARQLGIATSTSNVTAPKSLFSPLSDSTKKGNTPTTVTDYVTLSTIAHDIYYALHYVWVDDWATVWASFQKMKTQEDVTAMAQIFYGTYGADLWTYLQDGGGIWILGDGLSDVHLQQLHTYVSSLPVSSSSSKSSNDTNKNQTKKGKKNKNTNTNTNTQNLINQGQNLINQGTNLLG